MEIDPLDYWSMSEQSLLNGNGVNFLDKAEKQRGEGIIRVQELLEMSLEYAHVGAYAEATHLLDKALQIGEPYISSPLVYYYMGYYDLQSGNKEAALAQWKKASSLSTDWCFPFRLEEINIMNTVCSESVADARAPYYLGNLYYFLGQKEKGMVCWEQAVSKDTQFAQAWRNLGFGYNRQNDRVKQLPAMKRLSHLIIMILVFSRSWIYYMKRIKNRQQNVWLYSNKIFRL